MEAKTESVTVTKAQLSALMARLDSLESENTQLKAKPAAAAPRPIAERNLDEVLAATSTLTGMNAQARTFSTGSRGYYCSGKIKIAGKTYQASCNLVELGSKPK